ncbi:DUF2726 domain-containing protein [Psychrobacter sp. HD31]|uniref:DUF2726 domain-containing protein n=1 Tax=Psychrobacter sp. HD31 TaxID=3112003 RepID=UPI003DA3FF1C
MSELVILGMAVIGLIGFLWIIIKLFSQPKKVKKIKTKDSIPVWPYQTMPIMTDTEVLFFLKLKQALPEFYIFSQVQLSRIIEPNELAENDRNFWFNRICRQSLDYILVGEDLQTVLLAIELDDWTHDSVQRQNQDAKKSKALASAGIPIIRFHSEKMPSYELIRADVLKVLNDYPVN